MFAGLGLLCRYPLVIIAALLVRYCGAMFWANCSNDFSVGWLPYDPTPSLNMAIVMTLQASNGFMDKIAAMVRVHQVGALYGFLGQDTMDWNPIVNISSFH